MFSTIKKENIFMKILITLKRLILTRSIPKIQAKTTCILDNRKEFTIREEYRFNSDRERNLNIDIIFN